MKMQPPRLNRYEMLLGGVSVLFVSLFCAFFALPSLLLSAFFLWKQTVVQDKREFWRVMLVGAVFGLVLYGLWMWLFNDPLFWLLSGIVVNLRQHVWQAATQLLALLWLMNVCLMPACCLLLGVLLFFVSPSFSNVSSLTSLLSPHLRRSSSVPTISVFSSYQTLGVYHSGELDHLIQGGEVAIPPAMLQLHGLLIGEPQFGKSWSLIRLATIARSYGRKIIYLDLKGSKKTAALFLAAMGCLQTPVKVFPIDAYDGWRGTPKALFNRLMEQIDPKTHPFYRGGVGSTVISLAVHAPSGMPRNSYEFLARIDYQWLKATYATDAQAMREIEALIPHIGGLQLVMAGFFRGIAGGLDGLWAYEDCDACYIGIDSITYKEEAALLGRYLLDDAADYATSRKRESDQALLIIDEFGGLRSTNATGLFEKIRESGVSIYASAQSYEALGAERDSLLAASSLKILHRTGHPDPVLHYAGERESFSYSRIIGGVGEVLHPLANQITGPDNTQQTMIRSQKDLTILVEDVQQLEVGQIALITGGKGGFVQVHPLAIPQHAIDDATNFLEHTPRFTPLAPPRLQLPAPQPSLAPLPLQKKIAANPKAKKNAPSLPVPTAKPKKRKQSSPQSVPTSVAPVPKQQDDTFDFFA